MGGMPGSMPGPGGASGAGGAGAGAGGMPPMGGAGGMPPMGGMGGMGGMDPAMMQQFMQMQGMGGAGGAGAGAGAGFGGAPADTRPAAERYAAELVQLKEMGFTDEATNLQILGQCSGNVNMAIERLFAFTGSQ